MADLLKLADELRFAKKFEKVSLGQGQGPKVSPDLYPEHKYPLCMLLNTKMTLLPVSPPLAFTASACNYFC